MTSTFFFKLDLTFYPQITIFIGLLMLQKFEIIFTIYHFQSWIIWPRPQHFDEREFFWFWSYENKYFLWYHRCFSMKPQNSRKIRQEFLIDFLPVCCVRRAYWAHTPEDYGIENRNRSRLWPFHFKNYAHFSWMSMGYKDLFIFHKKLRHDSSSCRNRGTKCGSVLKIQVYICYLSKMENDDAIHIPRIIHVSSLCRLDDLGSELGLLMLTCKNYALRNKCSVKHIDLVVKKLEINNKVKMIWMKVWSIM